MFIIQFQKCLASLNAYPVQGRLSLLTQGRWATLEKALILNTESMTRTPHAVEASWAIRKQTISRSVLNSRNLLANAGFILVSPLKVARLCTMTADIYS